MLSSLQTCTKPKLFIGNTDDPFNPGKVTQKIFDLSAKPKYIHIFDSNQHDYRKNPQRLEEIDDLIVKFALEMKI